MYALREQVHVLREQVHVLREQLRALRAQERPGEHYISATGRERMDYIPVRGHVSDRSSFGHHLWMKQPSFCAGRPGV